MRAAWRVLVIVAVLALALGIGQVVARGAATWGRPYGGLPSAWAWCGHWGAASVCVQATTLGWPQPAPSGTWYVVRCP